MGKVCGRTEGIQINSALIILPDRIGEGIASIDGAKLFIPCSYALFSEAPMRLNISNGQSCKAQAVP